MRSAFEQLTKAVQGRHGVVFVRTWEEERAAGLLAQFFAELQGGAASGVPPDLWSWSCVLGLTTGLAAGQMPPAPGSMPQPSGGTSGRTGPGT